MQRTKGGGMSWLCKSVQVSILGWPSDAQVTGSVHCSLETLWVVINNRLHAGHYSLPVPTVSLINPSSAFASFARFVWSEQKKRCLVAPRRGNQCSINLGNLGNKCFHRHCWDCAIQCIFPIMKMARRAIMLLRLPAFAFRQLLRDFLTRSLNYFYSMPLHSHLESAIDPPTSWQQISASVTFICKSHGDFSFLQKKKPFTGTCFKSFE